MSSKFHSKREFFKNQINNFGGIFFPLDIKHFCFKFCKCSILDALAAVMYFSSVIMLFLQAFREPPPIVQKVCYLTLQDLLKDTQRLPTGWIMLQGDEHCAVFALFDSKRDSVVIKVTVHADLSAVVRVLGMPASHLDKNMEGVCLSQFLTNLSSFHVCTGITDPTLQTCSKPPSAQSPQAHFLHTTLICPEDKPCITSCVRSASCLLLSNEPMCKSCTKTIPVLEKKKSRSDEKEQTQLHKNTPLHTASHTTLKKEVKELRKTNSTLEKELKTIRTKIEKDSVTLDSDLHDDLNKILSTHESEIHDDLTRLFWQEQSKAFKTKDRGVKWHPMMIRLALLIHSKGPSVYKTLRDTGVLKLPGESTLRDYSNYIHPQAGFNPQVIEELKEQASKLPADQRFVCLLHDEMSVKEDLVWDSKTGQLVGFVNLNQWQERSDFNSIASHILVFYVVGINSSLKFSMGFFGSSTATADEIYPLFWQAVSILELNCQLKVIASTSDKASPNQRFYQIHGKPKEICYKTCNFYAPDREIFFFSDVPHLMKTVRNNLFQWSWKRQITVV